MLNRLPDGSEIPAGKVQRTLVADFIQGTLPSWLEVPAGEGTATFVTPATDFGWLQVATDATANAKATLRTSFDIHTAKFEEIRWTVQAVALSGAGAQVRPSIAVDNTTAKGVEFYDDGSDASRTMLRVGAGAATATDYNWLNDSGSQRRNLTLRIFPKRGQIYVCEDDQVFVYSTATQAHGACRARVQMQTLAAVSHWFRVSQVRLDLFHN